MVRGSANCAAMPSTPSAYCRASARARGPRASRPASTIASRVSQSPHGQVKFGVYAAGSQLAATGLVSAGGMTREAALGKLFALLGAGLAQAEVEHWFGLDLCGERAP